MFFNDEPNTNKLKPAQGHLKQDTSVSDAFIAGFGNSYGVSEEVRVIREARKPIDEFISNSGVSLPSALDTVGVDAISSGVPITVRLQQLRERGVEIPKEFDFKTEDEFRQSAFSREAGKFNERKDLIDRSSGSAKVASVVGSLAGSFDDIENVATLPFGAASRAGYIATAAIEGSVNAGIEGLAFDQRQDFLKKLDVESDETRVEAAAAGFLFGAVGGTAIKGASDVGRLALNRFGGEKKLAEAAIESGEPRAVFVGEGVKAEVNAREAIGAIEPEARKDFNDRIQQAHDGLTKGENVQNVQNVQIEPERLSEPFERLDNDIGTLVNDGDLPPSFRADAQRAQEIETRIAEINSRPPEPAKVIDDADRFDGGVNNTPAARPVDEVEQSGEVRSQEEANSVVENMRVYEGALNDVDTIGVPVEDGTGVRSAKAQEIIDDIHAQEDVADLIKACKI